MPFRAMQSLHSCSQTQTQVPVDLPKTLHMGFKGTHNYFLGLLYILIVADSLKNVGYS